MDSEQRRGAADSALRLAGEARGFSDRLSGDHVSDAEISRTAALASISLSLAAIADVLAGGSVNTYVSNGQP